MRRASRVSAPRRGPERSRNPCGRARRARCRSLRRRPFAQAPRTAVEPSRNRGDRGPRAPRRADWPARRGATRSRAQRPCQLDRCQGPQLPAFPLQRGRRLDRLGDRRLRRRGADSLFREHCDGRGFSLRLTAGSLRSAADSVSPPAGARLASSEAAGISAGAAALEDLDRAVAPSQSGSVARVSAEAGFSDCELATGVMACVFVKLRGFTSGLIEGLRVFCDWREGAAGAVVRQAAERRRRPAAGRRGTRAAPPRAPRTRRGWRKAGCPRHRRSCRL